MKAKNLNDKHPIIFNLITLGNAGVGKTSIISRYCGLPFESNNLSTIGIEFSKKVIFKDKKNIYLKLIDTSGQEKFKSLSASYLRHAEGVLFVFALNNKGSFEEIKNWVELFDQEHFGKDNIPKYLVGNKCDLVNDIVVDEDSINNFINNNKDMIYFRTSAKENINIENVFQDLGEKLYKEYKKSGIYKKPQLKLEEKPKKKKKECCNSKVKPDI